MKNIKLLTTNFLLVIIFSVSAVYAGNISAADNKSINLVARNLSAKLKTDLITDSVSVKFTNIEKNTVSNGEVVLKGDAIAVLPKEKTELPIKFEANVNPVDEVVNDVEYVFVESNYAPTTDEEILMRHLLKKIAADYKTENVVIAIDGFETENAAQNQKEYKGLAEVRVGEVEWKRIDFDVVLNKENKAQKIEYKLQQ